ncbi:MAG TPA: hypothetical protein VIE88_07280 [Vicinamibacteria bacterium]
MNGRTVSAMMISMVLGTFSSVAAAAERRVEAEPAEAQVSLTEAAQAPIFTGSLDFRRAAIADGSFDQPSSGAFQAAGIGMFVVAGADLATTELGLARPGVYEANPMQGNRSVRILTHVAAPAFMYWVTNKLQDKGKTKTALVARIGFSVAYSYIVMHNLRTASALPQ